MSIITLVTSIFLQSPLLFLFSILGLGQLIGRIRIGSFSLGVSAILFVGLGLSALHPDLQLPAIIFECGLVLFVYTVGIASGPAFFGSLRRSGLRNNLFGVTLLLLAAVISYGIARFLRFGAPLAAGVLAGSLTNTPALAGIVETLRAQTAGYPNPVEVNQLLAEPVVGYSLTYPFGVVGVILAIHFFSWLWRVDFAKENTTDHETVRQPLLQPGESYLLSDQSLTCRSVQEIEDQNSVNILQIRRGDSFITPTPGMLLHLGDQVTVANAHKNMKPLRSLFGDSQRVIAEVDIPTLALGISLGLLIGLVPIPLPGGIRFRLGFAGGPLIVALVLGYLGKTGPCKWSIPYTVNHTLRHLGIVLFLAGIGSRAGYAFSSTFHDLGITVILAGAVTTFAYSSFTLIVGYKVLKVPMSVLSGFLAGLQTQPAVLVYSTEKADSDLPNIGYATIYPTAMIMKIILGQVMLNLLM